jgi:hypothetical protein
MDTAHRRLPSPLATATVEHDLHRLLAVERVLEKFVAFRFVARNYEHEPSHLDLPGVLDSSDVSAYKPHVVTQNSTVRALLFLSFFFTPFVTFSLLTLLFFTFFFFTLTPARVRP